MLILHIVLFIALTAICNGTNQEKFREECLEENDVKEEEMKMYESIEDIPEKVFCFSKCLYTKMKFLKENGKINIDKLDLIAGTKSLKIKYGELQNCVKEVDTVANCTDMKKIQYCFAQHMK